MNDSWLRGIASPAFGGLAMTAVLYLLCYSHEQNTYGEYRHCEGPVCRVGVSIKKRIPEGRLSSGMGPLVRATNCS
jgi:hypothetical protein